MTAALVEDFFSKAEQGKTTAEDVAWMRLAWDRITSDLHELDQENTDLRNQLADFKIGGTI